MASRDCLNCATPLAGRWCHACGQDSRDPLRAVGTLLEELLDSALSWDSRVARTFRLLVTQPGALTDEFVAGRRAGYLGPVRLYVLASIVYAATYVAFGGEASLLYLISGGDLIAGHGDVARIEGWLSLALLGLMPFAAVATALTFRAPGIGFVEHLVFTLHLNSLVLLLWAAGCPLGAIAFRAGGALAEIATAMAVNLVVFFYGFRAARRHYHRSDLDAFLRLCLYGMLSVGMLRGVVVLIERAAGG
jgi:hypothetical protein